MLPFFQEDSTFPNMYTHGVKTSGKSQKNYERDRLIIVIAGTSESLS